VEELLHAFVEDIRLEPHCTLKESICDTPHYEDLVTHEEAVWLKDAVLFFWFLQRDRFRFVIRCSEHCI
jgi:hypothetical protein